jgi:putative oxidoreductase
MFSNFNKLIAFVGRLMVGGFYLYYGLNNLVDYAGMTGYAAFKGVPMPSIAVAIGAVLLVIGSISLLVGYRPVLGISALILFLLPVTMMMHNFWTIADPQMHVIEQGMWMRNMALAGAALVFLAIPRPWVWSVDEVLARNSSRARIQTRLAQ